MGLSDIIGIVQSLVSKAAAEAADNMGKYSEQCAKQQERINQYEAIHGKNEKTRKAQEELDKRYKALNSLANINSNNDDDSDRIGGLTVEQWDCRWMSIGMLKNANLTLYNHCVGLYRHKIDGEIMYIGRAIELNNGGFRKRLSDYRRESDSARTHTSGRTINANLDRIFTDILIVGSTQSAVKNTIQLERLFIDKYDPPWNNR